MAHALAAYFRDLDFDTAFLADDALVFHALILAAQAFIILDRTKDARAEQAVTFGLERAVVDGFGLLDLAERPRADAFRARSEEHTSELQSLMRISYAVFCLKKKTIKITMHQQSKNIR